MNEEKSQTNQHSQYENVALCVASTKLGLNDKNNLAKCAGDDGLITPLLPLLSAMWCEETKEYLRDYLAKTSRHYSHLEALEALWRSLGCPRDGFWPALLVAYNRISDSSEPQP